jgi:flagellar hook-associated protein 3 FlgL
MRISNQMMSQTALSNLQASLKRMAVLQDQASSGKRIRLPEDDPAGTQRAMGYRASISGCDTLLDSLGLTDDWLSATSDALDSLTDLLTDAETVATKGANETLSEDELASLAAEIDGHLEEVVDLANTRSADGQYLFSGFKTNQAALIETRDATTGQITGVTYQGDSGTIMRDLESGSQVAINVTADSVFTDVISAFINLRDALQADTFNVDDVTAALTAVQEQMDAVLDVQAAVGSKMVRVDSATTRTEDRQTELTALLSETEDADMAEAIVKLTNEQTIYQSALNVNAQMLGMSLLDYL